MTCSLGSSQPARAENTDASVPGGAGPVQGLLTLLAGQAICAALATARMQPSLSCSVVTVDVCCVSSLYTQLNARPSLAFMHRCGSRLQQRIGKRREHVSHAPVPALPLVDCKRQQQSGRRAERGRALTDRALAFRL